MRHQLGHATDVLEQRQQQRAGEPARIHDPDGPLVHQDAPARDALAVELGQAPQPAHGEPPAETRGAGIRVPREPDVCGAALSREPDHDVEDRWQRVQVLMRVEMAHGEPGVHRGLDLASSLALELREGDATRVVAPQESAVVGQQRVVAVEQGRDLRRRRERALAHEGEVHADVEVRRAAELLGRVAEGLPVRHDAAGGEDAVAMSAQDPARDAGVQADVVAGREEDLRQSCAFATTVIAPTLRRGCFISGYRDTSSRRILTITPADDSVDRPRVRGK